MGALGFQAQNAAITGVVVQDLDITDGSFSGIELMGPQGISGLMLTNVAISNPGANGIRIQSNVSSGNATATGVVVSNPNGAGLNNGSGGAFTINRGAGNSGW